MPANPNEYEYTGSNDGDGSTSCRGVSRYFEHDEHNIIAKKYIIKWL